MTYNTDNTYSRRKTKIVRIGKLEVGGNSPISVQSMTNTITEDIDATVAQIIDLENEGVDIVRVSCPTEKSSLALKEIIDQVSVPIVADIHFHYKRALEAADSGASCLRINPGNIGPEKIKEVISAAKSNDISMRIGVNAGSLSEKFLINIKNLVLMRWLKVR